ncbi:MAG: hypothetical protein AAGC97_17925, partial [Planctomycetota bacterium]
MQFTVHTSICKTTADCAGDEPAMAIIDPEPTPSDHESSPVPPSRWVLFAGLAAIGGGLDLWTKQSVFAWR